MPTGYQEILMIQCGGLGDLITTLPAFQALRAANSQARITLLSDRKTSRWDELLRANDAYDELWLLGEDRMSLAEFRSNEYAALRQAMRERKFDLAVDFEVRADTAGLVRASGARVRVGRHSLQYGVLFGFAYNRRAAERARDCGNTLTEWRLTHESDRMARIARAAGAPLPAKRFRLRIPDSARAFAEECLRKNELNPREYAVIQIAGSLPKKQWPLERYASIASKLFEEKGLRTLWIAAPAEQDKTMQGVKLVQNDARLAITETICQAAGLIERAALWLGPDTGPMHLAHALAVRTVGLFSSARPAQWGPRGPADYALGTLISCRDDCPPTACKHASPLCITAISEEMVWEAICDSLQRDPAGPDLPEPRAVLCQV